MQSQSHKCLLQEGERTASFEEALVVEKALQIVVNGQEFSMTMQTPGDERFLIRGLLHGEGINFSEIEKFSLKESSHG